MAAIIFSQIPNGFDLAAVPLNHASNAIGLAFWFRSYSQIHSDSVGHRRRKIQLYGFGLRYNIDQWLPLFPVNVAVHFMTQKMNFISKDDKDIFNASGTAYGVEVSKKLLS